MTSFLKDFRAAAHNRAVYKRTVRALREMNPAVATDLGIAHQDPRDIAYRAVYGR